MSLAEHRPPMHKDNLMQVLNKLKWVAELDDIDHAIRDIASDAADEINNLVERLHTLETEIQVLHARLEQMEVDRDLAEHGF